MIIELHLLQNFPPSNLNRDESGSPKQCVMGGVTRARVSSQCWKRAIRTTFTQDRLVPHSELAQRSKRIIDEVADRLGGAGGAAGNADHELRLRAVAALINQLGLAVDEENRTQYLLFLAEREIQAITEVVNRHWDLIAAAAEAKTQGKSRSGGADATLPVQVVSEVLARLDGGKAVDLALFGRMIANRPDANIVGACQVAHAISTNRVESPEFDFFTAVDDLKPTGMAGAEMLGTIEYNSACFYRYASVDVDQLFVNLQGDERLTRAGVEAFVRAAIRAIPSGKQHSMAAFNPPSLVLLVARRDGQANLSNAFVRPVAPTRERDLVQGSIAALDSYWGKLRKIYGLDDAQAWVVTTEPEQITALRDANVEHFEEVLQGLLAAITVPAA